MDENPLLEGPLLTEFCPFCPPCSTSITSSVMAPGQIPHSIWHANHQSIMAPEQTPHPYLQANRQSIMAPSQIPHPVWQANRPSIMAPGQISYPVWQTNRHSRPLSPGPFRPRLPPYGFYQNVQRDMWIIHIKDTFQQIVRQAECQPSNGTVRRVDPPDDETRFTVAYSFAPDQELHRMFVRLPMLFRLFDIDFVCLGENLQ